jgi:fibrillarin-like rRNA methylase
MAKELEQLNEKELESIENLYKDSVPIEEDTSNPTAYYTLSEEVQAVVTDTQREETAERKLQATFEHDGTDFYIYTAPLNLL